MWVSVLLAGICGALAALLAKVAVRDAKGHGVRYTLVFIGLFALLSTASRAYLRPTLNAWKARSDAQSLLKNDRLWSLLDSRHPEIGERFTETMVDLARSGASVDVARARALELGRSMVVPYFGKYAPHASSESLVVYVSTVLGILESLQKQDPEACYVFLFGQGSEGATALALLTPEQKTASMSSLSGVIESAVSAPEPPPSQEDGQALLLQLVQTLATSHDEHFMTTLSALGEPRKPGVNRGDLCFATLETYRAIMQMPEPSRTLLMRHLFATT